MSFDRPGTDPDETSGEGRRSSEEARLDWLDDKDGAPDDAAAASPADDVALTDEPQARADALEDEDAPADEPDADDDLDDTGVLYEDQVEPEYGILGFTLRELIVVGAWLVGFVVSFFPIGPIGDTIWTTGIHWILMMGVPTAAVFLVVLRRLSPDGIRRVGSLGIDQFASVAASVAAVSWAQVLWQQVAATAATGAVLIGWVAIVGQLAMLVLVAATVFAPLLPRLREDFHGRLETLAHRNANPVRPVISRPRPERELVPPQAGTVVDHRTVTDDDDIAHERTAATAAEPRVETALTVVIPDGPQASDALNQTSVSHIVPQPVPVAEPAVSAPEPSLQDQAAPQRASVGSAAPEDEDADDIEVLYNTAAVEALQDIFAVDETTNPRRPVEHNTAPDGVAGSDIRPDQLEDAVEVGTAADVAVGSEERVVEPEADTTAFDLDAEPMLRRSRGEHGNGSAPAAPGQPEPFWILAPTERDVLDEHGQPLFRIGPTAWALAIEDRGGAFVVRHEDGRIGYLHDISDITKG
ncbi:hypothetical protein [Microbacterium esteraromaticum]|uniref:hypothetical protein n=1 Tax=Microbacterium esteraromaticum TaxID=57043 RepID=UPI0021754CCF|nr:hypothetical protein [Microbacterium esteraromaticum]